MKSLVEGADIENLKYFRVTTGTIADVPVEISRTGYTGDLGYEIWVTADRAVKVWDALMDAGRAFDIHPAGMLALDVARIEAGLLLIEVDFIAARRRSSTNKSIHLSNWAWDAWSISTRTALLGRRL